MLEAIITAVVKSLASYLVKYYLESSAGVKIEGAPGWFYKQSENQICVFTYAAGGLAAVDKAKLSAKEKMAASINEIITVMLYDKFRNISDPKEQKLIQHFGKDDNLPIFVAGTIKYKNIEYKKKQDTAYVKACIENQEILDYQKERLVKLKKALTEKRADDAFGELEGE